MLLETMQMVKDTGYDWSNWFTAAAFPKGAVVTGLNHSTYVYLSLIFFV